MSQSGDQDDRSRSRVVLLATDSSQSVIGEIVDGRARTIAYSAYGEQSAQQDVETRLGFNGQLRETNIGWYLLGNGYRAYNPLLMRFHSPDSWSPFGGGGLNAYMYCVGDPVNRSDPTGHASFIGFLKGVDGFLFGGSNYTGGRGFAPPIGGGPGLATPVHAPAKKSSKGVFGVFLAVAKGAGFKQRQKTRAPEYSRNGGSGSDNLKIGGQGNWGKELFDHAVPQLKKMDLIDSNPSYNEPVPVSGGGNSLSTNSGATGGMPLWNADTFAAGQQGQTFTTYPIVTPGQGATVRPPPGAPTHGSAPRPIAIVSPTPRVPPPAPRTPSPVLSSRSTSRDSTPPSSPLANRRYGINEIRYT
jgi:RHS repeat-associated protein